MVLGSAASIFEIEIIINEDTNNCHDFGEYVCIDCIIKAYGMLFFLKCLNILIPKIEYKINLVGKFQHIFPVHLILDSLTSSSFLLFDENCIPGLSLTLANKTDHESPIVIEYSSKQFRFQVQVSTSDWNKSFNNFMFLKLNILKANKALIKRK